MKHCALLSACLIALTTGVTVAQTAAVPAAAAKNSSKSPVAYVYISQNVPNVIDALAASADGTLTLVNSLPVPQTLIHLTVTKKYLFGIDGQSNIYSYSIASNGALKAATTTVAGKYLSGFDPAYTQELLQTDETGSTVYAFLGDSQQNFYLLSFKIESKGELTYLGKAPAKLGTSQLRFVQNNKFAVFPLCVVTGQSSTFVSFYSTTVIYKRESNGYLTYVGNDQGAPEAQSPDQFCPGSTASGSTDHLAVGYEAIDPDQNTVDGYAVGTYTVSSEGTPSTKSNYTNMPAPGYSPDVLSISPSGEILAVGGSSYYQFFHYNGGNPITPYLGPFNLGNHAVRAFTWDKSNHFYALIDTAVIPFTVTPTTYKQLTGYPIYAPYSMIVLSLE
jgi:hypothetical protein